MGWTKPASHSLMIVVQGTTSARRGPNTWRTRWIKTPRWGNWNLTVCSGLLSHRLCDFFCISHLAHLKWTSWFWFPLHCVFFAFDAIFQTPNFMGAHPNLNYAAENILQTRGFSSTLLHLWKASAYFVRVEEMHLLNLFASSFQSVWSKTILVTSFCQLMQHVVFQIVNPVSSVFLLPCSLAHCVASLFQRIFSMIECSVSFKSSHTSAAILYMKVCFSASDSMFCLILLDSGW